MPSQYMDLLLCERFHWSPKDLYEADGDVVEAFIIMWAVESDVQKAKGENRANL